MNKGMLTVGIIFLSLIALLLINVLSNYSTGGELDYYLVKETTDAAMVDALDQTFLRTCGIYRIDKEKFVESFLYRFADAVDVTRGYKVGFYDINEAPPKVSVKVDSTTVLRFKTKAAGEGEDYADSNITTNYDAILESKSLTDPSIEQGLQTKNSDLCKSFYERAK